MPSFLQRCLAFSAFATAAIALGATQVNYEVTFGESAQKFSLRVNESFISNLKHRVGQTKCIADDLSIPAYVDGPTLANASTVGHYWAETYDWSAAEADINQLYLPSLPILSSPAYATTAFSNTRRPFTSRIPVTPIQCLFILSITNRQGPMPSHCYFSTDGLNRFFRLAQ